MSENEEEAEPWYPDHGPDREEMAAAYLPEPDDWVAKTALDLTEPHKVATLREFDQMFPEVSELQPVIDEFLDEFLKGRTSLEGASRKEYSKILMSMFGGGSKEQSGYVDMKALLGADDDD